MSAASITVLMPAYNPGPHFEAAVRSILTQHFTNFELLILDDGTQDGSLDILASIQDPRIRLMRNPRNMGLVETLNIGLREANARYVARMDADDIAHPNRLAHQLAFMQANPDVAICGTWSRTIGEGITSWETHFPPEHADIVCQMLFNTGLTHPTVMFDKLQLQRHDLAYEGRHPHAEDYDLWTRAAHTVRLANLPEVLLDYRVHATQVSSSHKETQKQSARRIRENLIRSLTPSANLSNFEIHNQISEYDWSCNSTFYKMAVSWLKALSRHIRKDRPDLWPSAHAVCQAKAFEIHQHVYKRKKRWKRALLRYTF